ncbi:MAG: hypothetical protein M1284_00365 [Candidatus Parvarchaeota archaeon]|jgi:predicted nucleotidyltransferase|nr:hypothetical protein [Candidatus Parvarchaeota archaeon]MCL5420194.1 hypothetical protein [Candidatus Parvarchaeota archaeon]
MAYNGDNVELEIILLLLRGEDHLRSISRKLLIPHATIMRRLNGLIKKNAVDYKKNGKNKDFFLKKTMESRAYIYSAEMYKLLKLLKKYPELGVILNDVINKTDEKLVLLFGSYSKFEAGKESDIDIYAETNDSKVKESIDSLHTKISAKIGKFDTSSMLAREIIKNHVIIRGVEEFYERIKFFD